MRSESFALHMGSAASSRATNPGFPHQFQGLSLRESLREGGGAGAGVGMSRIDPAPRNCQVESARGSVRSRVKSSQSRVRRVELKLVVACA